MKIHRLIWSKIHSMGSGEGRTHWSVFEGVRSMASSTPETLMAEIDTAIGKLEYSRATALLDSPSPTPTNTSKTSMSSDSGANPQYDVKMADGAYRAGCASLAAGKLDEALQYLNVSLSKCPPDKTSAVAKLQSLISLTSQQLQKLPTWLFHFWYALLLWIPFDCATIWWSVVKYFNSLDLQFFLQFFLIHVFYCFKYSLLEVSSALLALFFSLYLLFILQ